PNKCRRPISIVSSRSTPRAASRGASSRYRSTKSPARRRSGSTEPTRQRTTSSKTNTTGASRSRFRRLHDSSRAFIALRRRLYALLDRSDCDVLLEQQAALEDERALIVEEVFPPVLDEEFRDDDVDERVRPTVLQLLDVCERCLGELSSRRSDDLERHID